MPRCSVRDAILGESATKEFILTTSQDQLT